MLFTPLQSKVLRLHRPGIVAADVARRSWTIAPAEERTWPAALFDRTELERISGFSSHTWRLQELGRIERRTVYRRPTVVSELEDAVLCGGNLYVGAFKLTMRDKRRLVSRISGELADAGVPCSSWLGGMYFGHWLGEDTALKLLAPPFGAPTEIAFTQTPHQDAYNALFGIERRLLPDFCRVRKATVLDAELFSSVRDEGWRRMTASIKARHPNPPHIGCMLLRGASGLKRLLVNEADIAERLRRIGFRVVDPSTATLDEILAAASGARIVVGVEGSQLAHGFHCLEPGGAMLVLQPPQRFGCIDKDRCDRKDVRYAFTVGRAEGEGFRIDLDALDRMLERVIAAIRPVSAEGLP